ncbi:hypothetical protein VP01_828g4 [Puccinia sorghi]|uniref:Bromo domain-containing protein n=1 Tax=Puccinia sorghi TaxID=27349 RepID=A0A0L6U9R4_9BASI|nr:hypothetical protein VP01_828g4 [Puccinia sorghi]
MLPVDDAIEPEPKLSIRQQLLLAQAVHQVQSSESTERPVDWKQVTELVRGFQQARKNEEWLLGLDPKACSSIYSTICHSHLGTKQDHQQTFDASQTLGVARHLYEIHLRTIAEGLLEEDKKQKTLHHEIEAIARGEWDDQLAQVLMDADNSEPPPVQSPTRCQSQLSLFNPQATADDKDNEAEKHAATGYSLNAAAPLGSSARKKSPMSRTKRSAKKEIHDPPETPSENKEASLGTAELLKGRKRKVPPTSLSHRKAEKTSQHEPDRRRVESASGQPESPNVSESAASDDDDTVVQQLTKSRDRATPSGPVTRNTRKGGLEAGEPSDPKPQPSQHKKIKTDQDGLPDCGAQRISDKSLRSRTVNAKAPSTTQEEETTSAPEKPEQGSESNLPSTKFPKNESPGANDGIKGTEESHSAAHSPSWTKKSLLENEHSMDGSHAGTPNSTCKKDQLGYVTVGANPDKPFAAGITDGNSTANQTPNSAKLPLFPAESSSAGTRAGSSTTTSDPTSFRRRMLKTHSSVQSNPISSIFRDPVKESEAPGYTSIVKRPMDLRTLAKKLRDGKVTSTEEYRRDLMLMLANAVMFNHEESEVTKHAKELMVECDRLVSIFMRGSRY